MIMTVGVCAGLSSCWSMSEPPKFFFCCVAIWELILQHAFRPAIAQENAPGQKQRSSSSPPTFACRHLQCTDADHVGNVDLKILFLFSSFWISAFGLWILAFGFRLSAAGFLLLAFGLL